MIFFPAMNILAIHTEEEHGLAVERLNSLIDDVGTRQDHPLYDLLDTLGTLIEAYEEAHEPVPQVRGGEMLGYLMEEHGLRQSDLPEIGSQGVVSELLSGRRELNVRQIRRLAERFGVAPAAFL